MMGQQQTPEKSTIEAALKPSTNITMLAAEIAVLLSWIEFFIRGNKFRGLFIAIWPPTILAFASYFNQKQMEERMEPFNRLSAALNRLMG